MVPASLQGRYVIRFTVTSHYTADADIERDWAIISETSAVVLQSVTPPDVSPEPRPAAGLVATEEKQEAVTEDRTKGEKTVAVELIQRKRDRLRRRDFGLSLLLSNVPMSPKFINGSFAALFDHVNDALFDHVDVVAEYARHISRSGADDLNGCPIRLSPRRRLDDRSRQYSLDHSFHLHPATRQRFVNRLEVRQGSLDSKIEEIFQAPTEEDDESEESGEKKKWKYAGMTISWLITGYMTASKFTAL